MCYAFIVEVRFRKTGQAIKRAARKRQADLHQRLEEAQVGLSDFLDKPNRIREYLVHRMRDELGTTPFAIEEDIVEEHFKVNGLLKQIVTLEDELYRLAMLEKHVDDAEIFDLSVDELIRYGFDIEGTG